MGAARQAARAKMHFEYSNSQPHHHQQLLVTLSIFLLLTTIKSTSGHAIETGDLSQEFYNNQQANSSLPNLRWLLVKSTSHQQDPAQASARPVKIARVSSKLESQVPPPQHTTTQTTTTTTSRPSSTERSLIDSILIDVESINSSEQERREKFHLAASQQQVGSDEEHVTSSEYLALGHMPTDSGEDPLESQITTTIVVANETQFATSQSLEGTSQSPPLQTLQNHQTVVAAPDAEEQKLLESNNVSAVLASIGRQPPEMTATDDEDDQVDRARDNNEQANINSPPVVTMAARQTLTCEQAYTQCALRKVCAPALRSYNDDCHDLITNKTDECSSKCLKSMIALRSSEEGDDLANCDCENNDYCLRSKARSKLCQSEVERAIDPKTIVSCSTASWICMADQLCSTALDYYYRNCQTLLSRRYCSMHCNNSLAILYRQPKASKLINCQCDGSEEFPCLKYRTLTQRLCLNKQAPDLTTPTHGGGTDTDNEDNEFAQTNTAPEAANDDERAADDDPSENLANDSLDMPPAPLVHGASGDGLSTTGNPRYGGGEANDELESLPVGLSANYFNGIRQQGLASDEYLPYVNSRYLHQQMRRQRQQHSRKQQRSSRRREVKRPFWKIPLYTWLFGHGNSTNHKGVPGVSSSASAASYQLITHYSMCLNSFLPALMLVSLFIVQT